MLINQLLALELSRRKEERTEDGAGGLNQDCVCVACFTSATGMLMGCVSLRVMVSGDTVKSGVRDTAERVGVR